MPNLIGSLPSARFLLKALAGERRILLSAVWLLCSESSDQERNRPLGSMGEHPNPSTDLHTRDFVNPSLIYKLPVMVPTFSTSLPVSMYYDVGLGCIPEASLETTSSHILPSYCRTTSAGHSRRKRHWSYNFKTLVCATLGTSGRAQLQVPCLSGGGSATLDEASDDGGSRPRVSRYVVRGTSI